VHLGRAIDKGEPHLTKAAQNTQTVVQGSQQSIKHQLIEREAL